MDKYSCTIVWSQNNYRLEIIYISKQYYILYIHYINFYNFALYYAIYNSNLSPERKKQYPDSIFPSVASVRSNLPLALLGGGGDRGRPRDGKIARWQAGTKESRAKGTWRSTIKEAPLSRKLDEPARDSSVYISAPGSSPEFAILSQLPRPRGGDVDARLAGRDDVSVYTRAKWNSGGGGRRREGGRRRSSSRRTSNILHPSSRLLGGIETSNVKHAAPNPAR